jgi:N-acetylmuramyl-L-alanine amidase, negative regulator of ampC, ampD|nr:MAG TPA: SH3 domain protein [Caudoviricetes sp.]
MNIQEWMNNVNGKIIDMDGAYGGQCWDLWSNYARNVYGIPAADTNTVDGYAASVYTARYDRSRALQDTFSREGANYTPVYGDVAFWNGNGMNHVAIVIRDNGNGTLETMSQNPNKAGYVTLTKNGIIGYFHPRSTSTPTPTPANNNVTITPRTYKVNVDVLNVRSAPSTSAQIVAQYHYGQTVNLSEGGVIADGYIWAHYVGHSGKTRYVALAPADKSAWYLVFA